MLTHVIVAALFAAVPSPSVSVPVSVAPALAAGPTLIDGVLRLEAKLVAGGTSVGVADYKEAKIHGLISQDLVVSVTAQKAGAILKIQVNGKTVGELKTDANGAGRAEITNLQSVTGTQNLLPLIRAGAVLTVGDAAGRFGA